MQAAGIALGVGLVNGLVCGAFEGLVPSFHGSLGVLLVMLGTLGGLLSISICALRWGFATARREPAGWWKTGFLVVLGWLPGLQLGFRVGLGLFGRT